jgi:hypothetical protein
MTCEIFERVTRLKYSIARAAQKRLSTAAVIVFCRRALPTNAVARRQVVAMKRQQGHTAIRSSCARATHRRGKKLSSGLIANYLHSSLLVRDTYSSAMNVCESADADLIDADINDSISVQLHQTGAFLYACSKAAIALRTRSLEHIVASIRKRKALAKRANPNFDRARNRELVAVFNRLRPVVPLPRDAGIFSSLALIEFLALHKSFPSWVWGITKRPLCVHSWVQQGGWVFNGPVEYVLRFTPILAV